MDSGRAQRGLLTAAKWAYVIIGLILVFSVSSFLYNTLQRQIASILFFMAGILALYFYYVKWFVAGSSDAAGKWPPHQTVCPDYLTPISPGKPGEKFKCVDYVGVSKNGYLRRASPAAIQQQIADPRFYFEVDPAESATDLRMRLQTYGLSWVSLFGDD
jgi:hypothetical protein